jgi:hypothetical protein
MKIEKNRDSGKWDKVIEVKAGVKECQVRRDKMPYLCPRIVSTPDGA